MFVRLKTPTAQVTSHYAYNLCRASIELSEHALQDAKALSDIAHVNNSYSSSGGRSLHLHQAELFKQLKKRSGISLRASIALLLIPE